MNTNNPIIDIAKIKDDVVIGSNVRIIMPSNLYGCEIGNNSFVGPFTEIQNDVKIGNFTKIQSHTFICSLVVIGNNCFIGHGVKFVNDKFKNGGPANGDKSKWENTYIGNNVSIGTNATILPVKICDNAVIGAGSVVTKDINIPGTYVGNPAKLLIPFVDLKKQYTNIKQDIDEAIKNVISETAFIGGKYVLEFENNFSHIYGIKHCISVANGTDSLYILMKMLGIGIGDEVITVANSWISTSETISQTGAKPVFVDIDNEYYTIDIAQIENKINSKTKCIIPVHIYGQA
jgi:acetyltransferase-like isoleucine patch superfamily enzyme